MISWPVAKPEPIKNAMMAPAYVSTRNVLRRSVENRCVFFCRGDDVLKVLSVLCDL